jgi:nitrate/nitrite transporter NarK
VSILRNEFSLVATASAGLVGVFSISSTVGRLLYGFVSDKLGKARTVTLLHLLIFIGFIQRKGFNTPPLGA